MAASLQSSAQNRMSQHAADGLDCGGNFLVACAGDPSMDEAGLLQRRRGALVIVDGARLTRLIDDADE